MVVFVRLKVKKNKKIKIKIKMEMEMEKGFIKLKKNMYWSFWFGFEIGDPFYFFINQNQTKKLAVLSS